MSECLITSKQELAALRSALGRSESRVKFSDGREVQYKNTDELLKAIKAMEVSINSRENPTRRIRRAFSFYINRGL